MAKEKKQKEEELSTELGFELDEETINKVEKTVVPKEQQEIAPERTVTKISEVQESQLVNCLKNEIVIARFISKARGMVTDPKHVLFGGMANGSKVQFTTPLLRSGGYADVLTKAEKNFLEYKLGLEHNALSVHNRNNNFWDDSNENGIGRVELIKGDNPLNLADPIDYIRYKILLANKEQICPSMQSLMDAPKATYRFVLVHENDSSKESTLKVNLKAQAYMEFGKIRDDIDKMRVIIEMMDGRPTAKNSKIDFLQGKIGELIEANTKMFLQIVRDEFIDNRVLIKKAIEAGLISVRGTFLYMKENNLPLCENGQDPTMSVAAKFLSLPKNQELKFRLEALV